MSHIDDILRGKLEQQLKRIRETGEKDWLRELVEWLIQELLKLEVTQFIGAEPHERSEERKGYRNGYR